MHAVLHNKRKCMIQAQTPESARMTSGKRLQAAASGCKRDTANSEDGERASEWRKVDAGVRFLMSLNYSNDRDKSRTARTTCPPLLLASRGSGGQLHQTVPSRTKVLQCLLQMSTRRDPFLDSRIPRVSVTFLSFNLFSPVHPRSLLTRAVSLPLSHRSGRIPSV